MKNCQVGLGGMALSQLLGTNASASQADGANAMLSKAPMGPAKAKRVIYLHMSGAPPQIDIFDDKPKLRELHM